MGVSRGRSRVERKPMRREWKRTDNNASSSGACEWLLMQYEEIDRKFPLVDNDLDERVDSFGVKPPAGFADRSVSD